jgi:hypothetical protein
VVKHLNKLELARNPKKKKKEWLSSTGLWGREQDMKLAPAAFETIDACFSGTTSVVSLATLR